MLPRRLATEGPGIAWADLDLDGREELVLPGGYQGALRAFRILPDFRFEAWTNAPSGRAQPMALPWDGGVLLAESSYTEGTAHGAALSLWPRPGPALAAGPNAVGSLAMADLDSDGSLEVFVGARVVPGQWPREPVSAVVSIVTNSFVVRQVFTDLDLDGDPDLAISAEWGVPRFFRNDSGRLVAWNRPFQLSGSNLPPAAFDGLWTSVNVGDFDGDGRPDVVLGNWGSNSYGQLFERPWVVHHGDLDADGSYDVVLGYHNPAITPSAAEPVSAFLPMLGLGELSASIPAIRERFKSHREYATANLETILGPDAARMRRAFVHWTESVVLLNRPDQWVVMRLPEAAQMAPVFGIAVADWDGDGREDLFLSQNFFGHNHGFTRDDAGRGLVLRGLGDGSFVALDPVQSGIRIDGEGRAACVGDADGDGRPDLFVAQHGGATRVLRNLQGKPGLRVRLDAGPGNPLGAGTQVRWVGAGAAGPVRVWRFGAGGGASDSAVQVLARPEPGEGALEVTWPGGKKSQVRVPAAARGMRISADGRVEEEKP